MGNLTTLLRIDEYIIPPEAGSSPLFIFRGDPLILSSDVRPVIEAEPHGAIAFCDYDPEGIKIALNDLPNIKGIIVPTARTCASMGRAAKKHDLRLNQLGSISVLNKFAHLETVQRMLQNAYAFSQELMAGQSLEYVAKAGIRP